MDAKTAAIAKTLGHGIRCDPNWDNTDRAKELMRDIQDAKFEEVVPFQEAIHDAHINGKYLVEAVPKNGLSFWSSGLGHEATLHTNPSAWPGYNNMGQILNELAIDKYGSFWDKHSPRSTSSTSSSASSHDSEMSDNDGELSFKDEQDGYNTGLPRRNDRLTNSNYQLPLGQLKGMQRQFPSQK